jgi:hypothetical protein
VSALGRCLLRLAYGLPADPADANELGRIFDATPLYGLDEPFRTTTDRPDLTREKP